MNRIAVRFTLAMLTVMFITAIVEASLIGYSLYIAHSRLPEASQKILEKIFPDSYDPFKFTDNEINVLILAQVGVLMIGMIIALLVARRISRPLMNVSLAASRVSRGDLSARAPVSRRRGGDETATLLRNFNAMADSLERLEGERRATSAAIAHELRTPLTILRGRLEAIRDDVITLDGKEISNLLSQTEVLSRLVTDLRTLSLADAGQISLERRSVDVRALVAQVVNSFEARAGDRGMKLVRFRPAAIGYTNRFEPDHSGDRQPDRERDQVRTRRWVCANFLEHEFERGHHHRARFRRGHRTRSTRARL